MRLGLKFFRPRARWLARLSIAAGLMAATAAASAHDTQTRWTRVNAGCYGAMDYDLGAVDCDGRGHGWVHLRDDRHHARWHRGHRA